MVKKKLRLDLLGYVIWKSSLGTLGTRAKASATAIAYPGHGFGWRLGVLLCFSGSFGNAGWHCDYLKRSENRLLLRLNETTFSHSITSFLFGMNRA